METHQGYVAKYFPERRYGFIRYTGGEIFFHQVAVADLVELEKGMKVEFELRPIQRQASRCQIRPLHERFNDGGIIPATETEIDLLKSYGVDLSNGGKVRAALSAIRSIVKDGDQ